MPLLVHTDISSVGFYSKLCDSVYKDKSHDKRRDSGRMDRVSQEGEMLRHALILFQDFQAKKTANMKRKIEENRAALPVTPFADTIVHTLRKNRVLLIAGDTGCGKSTQGKNTTRINLTD